MDFVLKGNLCYSEGPERLATLPGGFVVCVQGECQGVFAAVPAAYAALPRIDAGDALVMPGMNDLHLHAPQFAFRGTAWIWS